jgi:hypothetical protein
MGEAWRKVGTGMAAWARQNGLGTLNTVYQMALASGQAEEGILTWIKRANTTSLLDYAMSTIKSSSGPVGGVADFANRFPLLAEDLVANLALTYRTLSKNPKTTFLEETYRNLETVYRVKEASTFTSDVLRGYREYRYNSDDVNEPAISPQMLVVCQAAEWLPYLAGALVGAAHGNAFGSFAGMFVGSIPFFGVALQTAANAAGGVAVVHLQKLALSRITAEHELIANTILRGVEQLRTGQESLATVLKNMTAYVALRKLVKVGGTINALLKERQFLSEAGHLLKRCYGDFINLPAGLSTGAGAGVAVWFTYIGPTITAATTLTAALAAGGGCLLAAPVVIEAIRSGVDWLVFKNKRNQDFTNKALERQLKFQKTQLPEVCEKPKEGDILGMKDKLEAAAAKVSPEDVIKIVKAQPSEADRQRQRTELEQAGGEFEKFDLELWRATLLADKVAEKLQEQDDHETARVQAIVEENKDPQRDRLKMLLENLQNKQAIEAGSYENDVNEAILLFLNGRRETDVEKPDAVNPFDEYEKTILKQLRALHALYPNYRDAIYPIIKNIDNLRIRQLKLGLTDRELDKLCVSPDAVKVAEQQAESSPKSSPLFARPKGSGTEEELKPMLEQEKQSTQQKKPSKPPTRLRPNQNDNNQ